MVTRKKTKPDNIQIKEFDLGWFVGIIEGEGSVSARINRKTGYLTVELTVASTDEDMIDKLHKIYPGKSKYIREYKNHFKTQYIWAVTNRQGLRTVINKVLPYMGKRRKESMVEVLDIMDKYEQ